MRSSVSISTSEPVFRVPDRASAFPWLIVTLAVLALLAAVGIAAVRTSTPAPLPLAEVPVRPPLVVVEALPELAERMQREGAAGRFSGAVLVARGDEVIFRQVYGQAEGRPLELDSRLRLASVSKQFTAAAILRLQDEGILSIEDPLCRWIQPCPPAWAPIQLKHLLAHTSGVPDMMARPGWGVQRVTPTSPEKLTADSMRYGLQFVPGTKLRYSNAGYNLLADVVERASGTPFPQYLRSAFFDPLGMADTGFDDGADHDIIMGYADLAGGRTPQPKVNPSILYGSGGLYTTLDDMLVWERTLHRRDLLTPESYAQMIADHATETQPSTERGRPRRDWGFGLFSNTLGMRVDPPFLDRQIYHTGSWSGFRNLVTYQPDADVTVIVLSNNFHQAQSVFLISQQAMAEALGRPFPQTGAR